MTTPSNPPVPCRVDGCTSPVLVFGQLCHRHRHALNRHGSVQGRLLRQRELARNDKRINAGLRLYGQRPAILHALGNAAGLLRFRAVARGPLEQRIQYQFDRLNAYGVTPEDVLRGVIQVYFLDMDDVRPRFTDERHLLQTLARVVLRLAPLHGMRASASMYGAVGALVKDALGVYAHAFVRKVLEDEANERATRGDALVDLAAAG